MNTFTPPLLAILLFQVPAAYLGALGIGAVRPLKKWSEVLLLPFSPWLFVTTLPLSMVFLEWQLRAGLPEGWIRLIPPILLSVPMLFVLTLFFKGQEPKWRAAQAAGHGKVGAFVRNFILPSLPLVALLACGSLLLGVWDLLWPLMVGGAEDLTANEALLRLAQLFGTQPQIVAAATTLFWGIALAFFLAVGLLQALYLDRLALTSDRAGPAGAGV